MAGKDKTKKRIESLKNQTNEKELIGRTNKLKRLESLKNQTKGIKKIGLKKGGAKVKKGGSKPSNPKLYASVKSEAKRKFKVYPSAYANAWLVRTYKKRGGGYA